MENLKLSQSDWIEYFPIKVLRSVYEIYRCRSNRKSRTGSGILFGKKRTMNSEQRAESLWSTIMRVNTISGFPRPVPLGLFGSGQRGLLRPLKNDLGLPRRRDCEA